MISLVLQYIFTLRGTNKVGQERKMLDCRSDFETNGHKNRDETGTATQNCLGRHMSYILTGGYFFFSIHRRRFTIKNKMEWVGFKL